MKAYIPSVRDIPGCNRAPVLADPSLSGDWIPPMLVYLARDVDKELAQLRADNERLRASNRLLQQRDDYVSGCLV
jgi:hypothetical protein